MSANLNGRAAIVTGASKGIGHAVAEALASAEANVFICARDEAAVRAAARELGDRCPARVVGMACDMRRHSDVQRLIGAAIDEFGRIDVLVNNAGVGAFAPVDELSLETWHQVIETNLNGVYYASHEMIPHMTRQGEGWIINIGSLAGKNAFAGGAAYNASKFGLVGFTEAMMLDVRDRGIRVSCIMPGSVATHFSGPGRVEAGASDWKLQPADIATMVLDLLAFDARALPSRVEMRPSRPPRRD